MERVTAVKPNTQKNRNRIARVMRKLDKAHQEAGGVYLSKDPKTAEAELKMLEINARIKSEGIE